MLFPGSLPCSSSSSPLRFNSHFSPDDGPLFFSPSVPGGFASSFLACRRVSQVRLSDSRSDSLIRASLHGCLDRGRGREREKERGAIKQDGPAGRTRRAARASGSLSAHLGPSVATGRAAGLRLLRERGRIPRIQPRRKP